MCEGWTLASTIFGLIASMIAIAEFIYFQLLPKSKQHSTENKIIYQKEFVFSPPSLKFTRNSTYEKTYAEDWNPWILLFVTVIILSSMLYCFGKISAFFGIWFFVFVLFVELLLIFVSSVSVYFRLKSKKYYYYKDLEIAGKKLAIANVILVIIWFVLPLIVPSLQRVFQEAQNLKSVADAAKYYLDNASNFGMAINVYIFQYIFTLIIYIYSFHIAWKCEKLGRK